MTTNMVHTSLETVLLFRAIGLHGLDQFALIAQTLQENKLIQSDPEYDAARLTLDALQELFLQRLWEELKKEGNVTDSEVTARQEGELSPASKKRKLQPLPKPTLQDAGQHVDVIETLLDKVTEEYYQAAMAEINEDEEEYFENEREIAELEREIALEKELEAGEAKEGRSLEIRKDDTSTNETVTSPKHSVGRSPPKPPPLPQLPRQQTAIGQEGVQVQGHGPDIAVTTKARQPSPGPVSGPDFGPVFGPPQPVSVTVATFASANQTRALPQTTQATQPTQSHLRPQSQGPGFLKGLQKPAQQLKWEPPYQPFPQPARQQATPAQAQNQGSQPSSFQRPPQHISPSQPRPVQLEGKAGGPLVALTSPGTPNTSVIGQFLPPPLLPAPIKQGQRPAGAGGQQAAGSPAVTPAVIPAKPALPLSTTQPWPTPQTMRPLAAALPPSRAATSPVPGHGSAPALATQPVPATRAVQAIQAVQAVQAVQPVPSHPPPASTHVPPLLQTTFSIPLRQARTKWSDSPSVGTPPRDSLFRREMSPPRIEPLSPVITQAPTAKATAEPAAEPATEPAVEPASVPATSISISSASAASIPIPSLPAAAPSALSNLTVRAKRQPQPPLTVDAPPSPASQRRGRPPRPLQPAESAVSTAISCLPASDPSRSSDTPIQLREDADIPRIKSEEVTPTLPAEADETTDGIADRPSAKVIGKRKRRVSSPSPVETPGRSMPQKPSHDPVPFPSNSQVQWTRGFHRVCASAMEQITHHRHANMFLKPIRERDAPGYAKVILQPVYLNAVNKSIGRGGRSAVAKAAQLPGGDPGTSTVWLQRSEDIAPPKGIINSSQLDRSLAHMFANAIMFNPDPGHGPGRAFMRDMHEEDTQGPVGVPAPVAAVTDMGALGYKVDEFGVVKDTRAMFAEVDKLVAELRSTEEKRARPAPTLATGSSTRQPSVADGKPDTPDTKTPAAEEDDEHAVAEPELGPSSARAHKKKWARTSRGRIA